MHASAGCRKQTVSQRWCQLKAFKNFLLVESLHASRDWSRNRLVFMENIVCFLFPFKLWSRIQHWLLSYHYWASTHKPVDSNRLAFLLRFQLVEDELKTKEEQKPYILHRKGYIFQMESSVRRRQRAMHEPENHVSNVQKVDECAWSTSVKAISLLGKDRKKGIKINVL